MSFSPVLDELMESFRCLPGVGERGAQRMAFYLLQRDREGGKRLAAVLERAMEEVGHCGSCRTLTEQEQCKICADPKRDSSLLCVVESPADMVALEQSEYRGRYFVLHGRLSPIEGVGVTEIGFEQLQGLAKEHAREIIIATSMTAEGDATAGYLYKRLQRPGLIISRIAHGVPLGGELDYVDYGTLSHAISQRRAIKPSD
jgi:recombination protein RecR